MKLSDYRSAYVALMGELNFAADAIEELSKALDAICANEIAEQGVTDCLGRYEEKMYIRFGEMLDDVAKAGAVVGLHTYTSHLIILVLMALILRKRYAEAGIDDAIFYDGACDMTWKLNECRAVKGINGTFVAGWFQGFYTLDRFALGRLQFELIRFGYEYADKGKVLKPDSTVINIHIPRTGQPLSPELVKDALDRAAAFYGPKLPEGNPIAFYCSSWLLYEGHLDYLPEKSNLRSFMALFHIIHSEGNEPGCHGDLWRLFDCDYDGNPDHLPADSSLRRGYIAMLKDGKPTGHGKGVFIY